MDSGIGDAVIRKRPYALLCRKCLTLKSPDEALERMVKRRWLGWLCSDCGAVCDRLDLDERLRRVKKKRHQIARQMI